MDTYTVIAIKFIMGTAVMILQINLLGKVEFAVNTPLNQIQNYVLGGIIGGVIYNKNGHHPSICDRPVNLVARGSSSQVLA